MHRIAESIQIQQKPKKHQRMSEMGRARMAQHESVCGTAAAKPLLKMGPKTKTILFLRRSRSEAIRAAGATPFIIYI